ncbi:MAG: hypothetical protein DRQ37_02785 [Gammaproteobacteria bacterium]|nr:MAG: hypothetical protein DRQ37_02785 [Gammaproteobacteria bacterium]
MNAYESDREQVEELKKWWKENGRMVVTGLVLGLGGVFGWTAWQEYQTRQAEQTSMIYEQLINTIGTPNEPGAIAQGEALVRDYPDSGYAPLAALVLARVAFEKGDRAGAERHLRWVMGQTDAFHTSAIARLRLARILMADKDYPGALTLLKNSGSKNFAPAYAETRGDIFAAQGNTQQARSEYGLALAATQTDAAARARVEMKLDDIGRLQAPAAETASKTPQ